MVCNSWKVPSTYRFTIQKAPPRMVSPCRAGCPMILMYSFFITLSPHVISFIVSPAFKQEQLSPLLCIACFCNNSKLKTEGS